MRSPVTSPVPPKSLFPRLAHLPLQNCARNDGYKRDPYIQSPTAADRDNVQPFPCLKRIPNCVPSPGPPPCAPSPPPSRPSPAFPVGSSTPWPSRSPSVTPSSSTPTSPPPPLAPASTKTPTSSPAETSSNAAPPA